jgi:5-methylcytosine-specific restriction endonuclease McrA
MWKLKQTPKCGTSTGYDWHTRQNREQPCQPCREAKASHWKQRRLQNRDALNKWRKAWRANPEVQAKENLRSQVKNLYSQVIQEHGLTCYLCNEIIDALAPRRVGDLGWEKGLHIDHVIPISKGGASTLENLRPCHAYCNQTKGAKC